MTDTLPSFAPADDADTREYVRALTEYEDTPDELPETTLDTQLSLAKLHLHNKVGADDGDFYADGSLGAALVATTAIFAKSAVENYSVTRWQIGDQEIDTSGVRGDDAPQIRQWNQMVSEGLSASDLTADGGPQNTTSYIG